MLRENISLNNITSEDAVSCSIEYPCVKVQSNAVTHHKNCHFGDIFKKNLAFIDALLLDSTQRCMSHLNQVGYITVPK